MLLHSSGMERTAMDSISGFGWKDRLVLNLSTRRWEFQWDHGEQASLLGIISYFWYHTAWTWVQQYVDATPMRLAILGCILSTVFTFGFKRYFRSISTLGTWICLWYVCILLFLHIRFYTHLSFAVVQICRGLCCSRCWPTAIRSWIRRVWRPRPLPLRRSFVHCTANETLGITSSCGAQAWKENIQWLYGSAPKADFEALERARKVVQATFKLQNNLS